MMATPAAAEIPKAVVILESRSAALPGQVPEAAPPRFVLLEDGQVYVGGTHDLVTARLAGRDLKDLERRISDVRKLPAIAGVITVGPGTAVRRLYLGKGRALDIRIEGDLHAAPPALRPLADLVLDLERFHHPALRPYAPAQLALHAEEGSLPGGCRPWNRPEPIEGSVFAPQVVNAADFAAWPTGAAPASVCAGDRRFVVTLRPLLPGEKP
ncbi:MAG: hypothetical protein ACMG6S_19865 [Byssovorax sp.]